jgi:hypothetical protein
LRAPLLVEIAPLPSLMPPCHLADPDVVVIVHSPHHGWTVDKAAT